MSSTKNVVLVTGAAGGIGSEVVKQLAATSKLVIATDSSASQLNELYSSSKNILAAESDLTQPPDLERLAKTCRQRAVNCVVHCAGFGGPFVKLAEVADEDWRRVFAVNVDSLFVILRVLMPCMVDSKYGRIVAISSIQGNIGSSGSSAYVASKHALNGLIKTVAVEYGNYGITANAVCPGYIKSPMGADNAEVNDYLKKVIARTPTKSVGTAQDVAKAVGFMLQETNSYLNGSFLTLDGGISSDVGIL